MKKKIFNINTELCVDLKTMLRNDSIARTGKSYQGLLTRNTEEHFNFLETESQKRVKRNPQVYVGETITVTRRDDGSYSPNFRPIHTGQGFNVEHYASSVANELLWALGGLVGEE